MAPDSRPPRPSPCVAGGGGSPRPPRVRRDRGDRCGEPFVPGNGVRPERGPPSRPSRRTHVRVEPGAKPFVDDLLLGRGFVRSRAAPSLRSIESQPSTQGFVSLALSLARSLAPAVSRRRPPWAGRPAGRRLPTKTAARRSVVGFFPHLLRAMRAPRPRRLPARRRRLHPGLGQAGVCVHVVAGPARVAVSGAVRAPVPPAGPGPPRKEGSGKEGDGGVSLVRGRRDRLADSPRAVAPRCVWEEAGRAGVSLFSPPPLRSFSQRAGVDQYSRRGGPSFPPVGVAGRPDVPTRPPPVFWRCPEGGSTRCPVGLFFFFFFLNIYIYIYIKVDQFSYFLFLFFLPSPNVWGSTSCLNE